jgi:hypothetical protein
MINFNQDTVFNLTPIDISKARSEVDGLLVNGEMIVSAFKTVRDQLLFTNKRIIAIDVQGLTGMRKSYTSLPFANVMYFTVQTPGFLEIFSDSEMTLYFSNGFTARFEFRGSVDIGAIGRYVSEYVLTK